MIIVSPAPLLPHALTGRQAQLLLVLSLSAKHRERSQADAQTRGYPFMGEEHQQCCNVWCQFTRGENKYSFKGTAGEPCHLY